MMSANLIQHESEKRLKNANPREKPSFEETGKLPSFTVQLLNRRITCITLPDLMEVIYKACVEDKKLTVASYNIHSFNLSMQLPWYYDFLQSADIARCDGMGILKALQFMGLSLPIEYRVSGTRFVPELLEYLNQKGGISFFLLGTKPKNLEAAIECSRKKYPNLRFAGHDGYFDKEDPKQNEAIIQQINQGKTNILIVGMGMPRQEKWIQQHRDRLKVNAILPTGAVIDRLAGTVSDCPEFISNRGLEWLYRLCSEPKRLAARYLLGNPAFAFQIALAKAYASSLDIEELRPNLLPLQTEELRPNLLPLQTEELNGARGNR
jgi:N-acetylglucosaminyldiphosphoundecaprenol N-acetyl-beta-D-mannosaminyltransferase